MRRLVLNAITIALLVSASQAQKLAEPKLTPTASTSSQDQLIREGVALHDRKDYDGAISRYEQVLKENPDNVLALYEMSFSYFEKKDYRKSLEIAYRVAQYKSEILPRVYVQIGNAFDLLDEPKKAIETYKAGIKLFPSDFLIHYNLALTYYKLGDHEAALAAVKKSAGLNPNHPSSHLLLATLFDRGSYTTPALLAACRFLVLEPASPRSASALELVKRKMQGGVSQGKDENTINIMIDTSAKKDEGDFGAIDMVIGLAKAAERLEKNKGKTPMQLMVGSFETLLAILGEQKGDRSKFTWKYYVPYFAEMKKLGHVEAFVFFTNRRSTDPEVSEWLLRNQGKVQSFLAWSKAYAWPKMD
ncbi:MAG TPA: tetratricopeptide repeat protein [Pyrinomonadaceae bacterium]|nr:tetratricopeptide repeat protein [Pyrinomonadaceae bacterium]